MFWDKTAVFYDFFINIKNGRVNREMCRIVAEMIDPKDRVLECACGTGMITKAVVEKGCVIIATDFSEGMLARTRKKLSGYKNVIVEQADITRLRYPDHSCDKVIAANVIHLLDDPAVALGELARVCRPGGKIIIPTYINNENAGKPSLFVRVIGKLGAGFKTQFDLEGYRRLFEENGYPACEIIMIRGTMPCAVAVIDIA